jgi:alcohol dehydrogenase
MKGLFKVNRKLPPFFAIPTTAGTGSEGTVAAVVSNPETHEKYPINDPVLIPHYAVLDPMLLLKLPKHITAATGMDALTHAVEAYIGKSNTNETREYAREAVQLIYDNLYKTYEEPENIKARSNMQHASYLAGLAFTRAYVGNIHAIAHTLSGFYNVPHGLANAVIMPYVLDFYGEAAHQPLAELADLIGISRGQTKKQQAEAFIQWIKDLNEKMGIPTKIEGILKKDIPQMVERALAEANPLYPVPVIMNKKEMAFLYMAIKA